MHISGVLNCSESAIRHGRVVQEWGKSVQLMFEQLLHERKKMMVTVVLVSLLFSTSASLTAVFRKFSKPWSFGPAQNIMFTG